MNNMETKPTDSQPAGRRFDSCQAHQITPQFKGYGVIVICFTIKAHY